MKLLRGMQPFPECNQGVVATIGNFDGVHLGHQTLISRLQDHASRLHLPLLLVLFEPQPKEYFQKDKAPVRLSSLREKLDRLARCGVDYVYCIRFNDAFAHSTAQDFACDYLFHLLRVKHLMVGADFRFGRNREGTVALLQTLGSEYGCSVEVASDFCLSDDKVSSTQIRQALSQGELQRAAHYLGRPYSVCGRVVQGAGRGSQWGIPTANLHAARPTLPVQGVFVVAVNWQGKRLRGVANVGTRPTVHGIHKVLEVHLFDFDATIYGHWLEVVFLHKLRDEKKFVNVDALVQQIQQDIAVAKEYA